MPATSIQPVAAQRALFLLTSLILSACNGLPAHRCATGEREVVSDMLYFGTSTPQGTVSADQWNDFINTEVTPRFPLGLTVWPAAGQWNSAEGTLVHEVSHVLALVHDDDTASDLGVRSIVSQYRDRFHQEAVLRVRSSACASL